jgi:succinate dehydrogenase / fumarate reductase membrane anchor subunit
MVQDTRSPLARASGLGPAGKGAAEWWAQRVSAVALVPLTLWFVIEIIAHMHSDYAGFLAWLRSPTGMIPMVLLLIALFHHAALGLKVVVEDYLHGLVKFSALVAVRLGAVALAVAGILAVLFIALSR